MSDNSSDGTGVTDEQNDSPLFGGHNQMPWALANKLHIRLSIAEIDDHNNIIAIKRLAYQDIEKAFKSLVVSALSLAGYEIDEALSATIFPKIYTNPVAQVYAVDTAVMMLAVQKEKEDSNNMLDTIDDAVRLGQALALPEPNTKPDKTASTDGAEVISLITQKTEIT